LAAGKNVFKVCNRSGVQGSVLGMELDPESWSLAPMHDFIRCIPSLYSRISAAESSLTWCHVSKIALQNLKDHPVSTRTGQALSSPPSTRSAGAPAACEPLNLEPVNDYQSFHGYLSVKILLYLSSLMSILMVDQKPRNALQTASHGYILEVCRMTMDETTQELVENEDVQACYMGMRKDAMRGEKGWIKLRG